MTTYAYYAEKSQELIKLPHDQHLHATVRRVWFKTYDEMNKWFTTGPEREKHWQRVCPPKPLEL